MKNIAIVGGCWHVRLPLGLAFASKALDVTLMDTIKSAVETAKIVY